MPDQPIVIYIYRKCSSCQKALRFLEKTIGEKSFSTKEITQQPPSLEELHRMLHFKNNHLKSLFNSSGQLYRDLQLTEKLQKISLNEALSLLNQNGMLVKRPFLIGIKFGLLGFKENEWVETLNERL